ncbi:MAG: PstS family phosphate ABC transporter substrate-binding protein [Candidatus Limnocylindrales bacterium]
MTTPRRIGVLAFAAAIVLGACTGGGASTAPTTAPTTGASAAPASTAPLGGSINIDGSSTVYPITEAVAEEFQKANSDVKVTAAFAGTGGGFKKFCNGETDMNDASRPIKPSSGDTADAKSEETLCKEAGVEWIELGIATDGLSVLVNPQNTWVDCLTTAELKKIWDAGSTVKTWADVRAGFPAEPIKLFGPGADSGTFDYFTEVINEKAKQSRSDYTQSENDNSLVTGVAGDKDALGYFGFAYYEENKDKIKIVPIDSGSGCITPSQETIADGTYTPLSRPLFIYPSKKALDRPEFAAFVQYYLDNVNSFVDEVGYIEATADVLQKSKDSLAAALK